MMTFWLISGLIEKIQYDLVMWFQFLIFFVKPFFPAQDNGVGGCATYGNGNKPQAEGTLVYLNGGDDLVKPLSRVEKAGGKVVMPKTPLGPNGFMAIFTDTEGNRVAFHSMK